VDISLLVEVIGKDRVLKRLEKALKTFGG